MTNLRSITETTKRKYLNYIYPWPETFIKHFRRVARPVNGQSPAEIKNSSGNSGQI